MSYWKMVTPEIEKAFDRVDANTLNPPKEDLKYLMEQYHEKIHRLRVDLGCPDCRRIVYNFWKITIQEWRQQNQS